jgi:hypothetical protein
MPLTFSLVLASRMAFFKLTKPAVIGLPKGLANWPNESLSSLVRSTNVLPFKSRCKMVFSLTVTSFSPVEATIPINPNRSKKLKILNTKSPTMTANTFPKNFMMNTFEVAKIG